MSKAPMMKAVLCKKTKAMEIRVTDGFRIKDALKARGYKFADGAWTLAGIDKPAALNEMQWALDQQPFLVFSGPVHVDQAVIGTYRLALARAASAA